MELDNNLLAFFALVRAGLWANLESTDIRNQGFTEPADWEKSLETKRKVTVWPAERTGTWLSSPVISAIKLVVELPS